MLTSRQVELVQESFGLIQPILDDAAVLFYGRLFELDPTLRQMFHRPRREQARLLAQTLTVVVKGIDNPSQLRGAVEALGRRHAGYGVRDEHYAVVGEALLWTLEAGLKHKFTYEVRKAWVAAYRWLATTMQLAATDAQAEARQQQAPASAA